MTVCLHKRSLNAVHHDDAIIRQYCQYLRHDFLKSSTVTAYEDCIRTRKGCDFCFQEVAYVDIDTRSSELTSILVNNRLALRPVLECFYMQVREQQPCFNGDASRAGSNIPENPPLSQVQSLQCQQPDWHFCDHLLAPVEQSEF